MDEPIVRTLPRDRAMSYSTLIFDLDGTLSDSSIGITRSINYALQHFGVALVDEADLHTLVGPPLDVTFRELVPTASEDDVNHLVSKFRERYAEIGYAENQLYEGIEASIRVLHGRGQRLGVCTAKRVDFAERIIAMFGLADCFAFIDGGEIGRSKAEQLAKLARARLIDADALMIGDRRYDIEAARANDLTAIGVLWGFGSLAELTAAQPNRLLTEPAELSNLT
jgi:phosphoglycolate phosphatase